MKSRTTLNKMNEFIFIKSALLLFTWLMPVSTDAQIILQCQLTSHGIPHLSQSSLYCHSASRELLIVADPLKIHDIYRLCGDIASNSQVCFEGCHLGSWKSEKLQFHCSHQSNSRSEVPRIRGHRSKRLAHPPPNPPGDIEIVSVTEKTAQLQWESPMESETDGPISYRVEIKPENSQRKFSMMTEETRISFEELQPQALYEVWVYSYRPVDGMTSLTSKTIQFTTKAEVYRLPMVMNPKAESSDYATLKISWELPHIDRSERPEYQIGHYRIMLLNLAASSADTRRWVSHKVPGGARVTSYVIVDLQPDSFYRVRIIAVSAVGIDGVPATIASSPRILSRPPSAPPTKVSLVAAGALTAAFTWLPPPKEERNGEIVAYQLEFNSPEWLSARELTVKDGLNYTLTGLNPRTNYTLTVAAATRAGVGPKSSPLLFTTALKTTQLDNAASTTDAVESAFGEPNFFIDPGLATLPPLKVHNLRYDARERDILLLWSIPPISATPHLIKGVIIRWGNIYPGPNKAEVSLEKRAYSIEPLEPSTTYMISVALLTEDGEGPVEMITAQTKPVSHAKDALIPLNFRLLSAGPDWAVMAWDAPTCSALHDEFGGSTQGNSGNRRNTQRASSCSSGSFPLTYELRYDIIETEDENSPSGVFVNCPENDSTTARDVKVNVTWVRLEHLEPNSRYVACVRAITHNIAKSDLIGDWSFVQIFETQHQENSGQVDSKTFAKSMKSTNEAPASLNADNFSSSAKNASNTTVIGGNQVTGGLFRGGTSDIWLALVAIMVTTMILMVIVIIVVCWAKHNPIMIVGSKPDRMGRTRNQTEVNEDLLSSPNGQRNGGVSDGGSGGGGTNRSKGAGERIALKQYASSQKANEAQLIDFTSKPLNGGDNWYRANETATSKQQPVVSVGNPVPMMGIRSAVDPMSGCGASDAASRGATGSSASSAISLLPNSGSKPNQAFISPTGNPLITPAQPIPPYGMYPSGQPQLGTFVQAYYHHQQQQQQHNQHPVYAQAGSNCFPLHPQPPPLLPPLHQPMGHQAPLPPMPPPPPPPPLSSQAAANAFAPMLGVTPSNIGGPRIDLSAGENEGTYLQYPGLPISRGMIAPATPSANASDLISESSSAGIPASLNNMGSNRRTLPSSTACVGCSTASTVSSSSITSNNNITSNANAFQRLQSTGHGDDGRKLTPMRQKPMGHHKARGGYNSLPGGRKENGKRASDPKSAAPESCDNGKAISTEELTQEMANLDGLMKDLSMITQNEFGCLEP